MQALFADCALYVYVERRQSCQVASWGDGSPFGCLITMIALDFRVKLSDVRARTPSETHPKIFRYSCPRHTFWHVASWHNGYRSGI